MIKPSDILRMLQEIATKSDGKYTVEVVPASSLAGFYGLAKDDKGDMRVYVSNELGGEEKAFIIAHELAHKLTDVDNDKLDEIVANILSSLAEPKGFWKILWRSLSWTRLKLYWRKYVRKIT